MLRVLFFLKKAFFFLSAPEPESESDPELDDCSASSNVKEIQESDTAKRYRVMRSVLRDLLPLASWNKKGNPVFGAEAVYELFMERMRVQIPGFEQAMKSVTNLRKMFTRSGTKRHVEVTNFWKIDVPQLIAKTGQAKKKMESSQRPHDNSSTR